MGEVRKSITIAETIQEVWELRCDSAKCGLMIEKRRSFRQDRRVIHNFLALSRLERRPSFLSKLQHVGSAYLPYKCLFFIKSIVAQMTFSLISRTSK